MEEVTKDLPLVKQITKSEKKSCEIVLFSSKTATEWLSSYTVACLFAKHSEIENRQKPPIFGNQHFLLTFKRDIKFFDSVVFRAEWIR